VPPMKFDIGTWPKRKKSPECCPYGHSYTPENTSVYVHCGKVYKWCKTCRSKQAKGTKST